MQIRHLGLPVLDTGRSLDFYGRDFGVDPGTSRQYPDGTTIVEVADGFDLALHPVAEVSVSPAFFISVSGPSRRSR